MLSYTAGSTLYQTLSQNTSAVNQTLYNTLVNLEHRYLLQKYFNNEGSYSITTIGSQTLAATGAISSGATSATLSVAWPSQTVRAQITFSDGEYRDVQFTSGSTAITWTAALTANVTSVLAVGGVQFYPLPPNYSKLKTVNLTVGNLKWTLYEVLTRENWDRQNVFPYYADIPQNYFIYPGGDHSGMLGIWPIPATSGNVITFNYKQRVPDLSLVDYSTGTVTVANGSTTVTSSGAAFIPTTNAGMESRWIQFTGSAGDNLWYQVASATSTTLTLYQPYQGISVSGGTYVLGQMPLLAEDFQDMLVYKALQHYYTSIVNKPEKVSEYKDVYNTKLELLAEYSGSNSVNVNLSRRPMGRNPNLFPNGNIG